MFFKEKLLYDSKYEGVLLMITMLFNRRQISLIESQILSENLVLMCKKQLKDEARSGGWQDEGSQVCEVCSFHG